MSDDTLTPAPEMPTPEENPIEILTRDNADLKDRLLRALADMENLRRRTEREVQDQRVYAVTRFAGDMIDSADNLRRALEALPTDETLSPAMKAMVEGVELTERELLKALEKHNVRKRAPVGERFDPNLDQAMFEIPEETHPNGTVLQVLQAGYTIGERVLRPTMVGVSKGGPPRQAESPNAPDKDPRAKLDKHA